MNVTAVVTAHGAGSRVADMVDQLHRQTVAPDEILVYASDVPADVLDSLDGCTVTVVPNMNDWGHDKRARGLAAAVGDWVGFFNDDDQYDPTYLEQMVAAADGRDLVMCRFSERGHREIVPAPQIGVCTAGNFIARTSLARQAGWNLRHYEADGAFIVGLVEAGARWTVVDRLLYWHK